MALSDLEPLFAQPLKKMALIALVSKSARDCCVRLGIEEFEGDFANDDEVQALEQMAIEELTFLRNKNLGIS